MYKSIVMYDIDKFILNIKRDFQVRYFEEIAIECVS